MKHTDAEIERARQHVIDGERRVAAQRRLIQRLQNQGHPTAEAERLLSVMLGLLEQMRAHLKEMTQGE